MRYKFYEQRDKIKKDPKYKLPADINAPVYEFLDGIKCKAGREALKSLEDCVGYGTIEIVNDDLPNAKIVIQVDSGMAEGRKEHLPPDKDGKWNVFTYKTVKNYNLDKKNPTKEVKK
jgi:hypothetical protein